LRFVYDDSLDRAMRIEQAIKEIHEGEGRQNSDDDE
jgi:ribosome-binding factor A